MNLVTYLQEAGSWLLILSVYISMPCTCQHDFDNHLIVLCASVTVALSCMMLAFARISYLTLGTFALLS